MSGTTRSSDWRLRSTTHMTSPMRARSTRAARSAGAAIVGAKMAPTQQPSSRGGRERVLDTAYELFSRHGTRAVGVDRIIAESGAAKMTLYRNFASKDELILAFLERREERWTRAWLQAGVEARAATPAGRLLAIFDLFGDWFATEDFEGCAFITILLEMGTAEHPVRAACVRHLAEIRSFLAGLAEAAGVPDADAVACQWHILMKGSIVAATEGDTHAAARAQELGKLLLRHHGVDV
jgi:AcrR family transcriptional regulator